MSLKKKTRRFQNELLDLLERHAPKIDARLLTFMMAQEMIYMNVHAAGNPASGLNEMFQQIAIAAGEQGYRLDFSDPTIH